MSDILTSTQQAAFTRAGQLASPRELQWLHDPVLWAHERMQVETWSKMRDILYSVRDNPETAVHSCHEASKTFTAALVTCWWLDTHPPGTARVVTTAPTTPQVKAALWHDINQLHGGRLPGRTNLTEWYIGNQLVAFGRKPNDYDPTAFQGTHALYMLAILDESCGIPKTIWDSASSLVANDDGRMLAIGNPDDPNGEFARVCKPGSGWNVIHIGYKDTPNFTDEPISEGLKKRLISKRWVDRKRIDWGEGSALFQAKCEGDFPTGVVPFQAIPYGWVQQCRYLEFPQGTPIEAGIDVGAGSDRTVVRIRRGLRAAREETFVDADPMRAVAHIVNVLNEERVTKAKVDVIGVGWALAGRLKELSSKHNPHGDTTHEAEIVTVNVATASTEPDRFLNLRAQLHWEARERSRLKTWDLSEVDDDTVAELTVAKYEIMDSKGKIKIEAKEHIIERTGRSPDRSDALLLAYYDPITIATMPPPHTMDRNLVGDLSPGSYGRW